MGGNQFFFIGGVESILGPLGTAVTSGLLYLPRVIVRMEKLVEWTVLAGGNLSTRRKPAPTPLCPLARPGREPGPPRWEASD
jgi:hypothetical protein